MPLPIKSRYTINEAAKFIANAAGEAVTTSQVVDYGIQRFYGLYMLAHKGCQVRYEDDSQIAEISGSLVQVHPNATQAATLESGYSMKIDSGLHDGRKCDFVEPGTSPAWRMKQPASFNSTDLILLGAELTAFTVSISEPQKSAPIATNSRSPSSPSSPPARGTSWTPERLAELKAYRERKGTKAAALHFGISEALIRKKLPGKKSAPGGFSGFKHLIK